MNKLDKSLVRKLTATERDALLTAFNHEEGRIAVEVLPPPAENEAHGIVHDLCGRGLLYCVEIKELGDDKRHHIFEITARGKRIARHFSWLAPPSANLETLYIKLARDDDATATHWITVEEFDVAALEAAESVTDQFFMLRPYIPADHHPVALSRDERDTKR